MPLFIAPVMIAQLQLFRHSYRQIRLFMLVKASAHKLNLKLQRPGTMSGNNERQDQLPNQLHLDFKPSLDLLHDHAQSLNNHGMGTL